MVNNKSFVIISIFIFLVSTNVFASNIGRAVYGVLTETYQGAAVDKTEVFRADIECVVIPPAAADAARACRRDIVGRKLHTRFQIIFI